jgi:hypothetical protein
MFHHIGSGSVHTTERGKRGIQPFASTRTGALSFTAKSATEEKCATSYPGARPGARGDRENSQAHSPLCHASRLQERAAHRLLISTTSRLLKNQLGKARFFMACTSGASPVCLVDLVCFVYLVDLVHLLSFVQPKNQTDRTDQMNKTGWRAFSTSC